LLVYSAILADNKKSESDTIMGRPSTRPKDLKDGYYVEVRNKGSKVGIRIRRDTEEEMHQAAKDYEKVKDVSILGESKNGKFVKN